MSKLTQSVFILDKYIALGQDIVFCLNLSGKIVECSLTYFGAFRKESR